MSERFNWIIPGLAQGAAPQPPGKGFAHADTIVFAAEELQPRGLRPPPGKRLLRVPLDDDPYRPVPPKLGQTLHRIASGLAREIRAGRKVMVTCAMGLNRSGIITALTLMYLYGMPSQDAIRLIRARRSPEALCNPMFEQWLLATRAR